MSRSAVSFHGRPAAFSLVEIVVALAIISFAIVAILGMFPVAIDAATNSRQETQAAMIAQSIYSELSAMPGTNAFVVSDSGFYKSPGNGNKITINLTTPNTYHLAYNDDASPQKEISAGEFNSGNPNASYLARISVATSSLLPGLSQVDIQVDAPAPAPGKARKAYHFATILSQNTIP